MNRLLTITILACLPLCGQDRKAEPKPAEAPVATAALLTREAVQARLAQLQKQYEQTVAQAALLQGAIQDCQFWLEQVKASEAAAKAPRK